MIDAKNKLNPDIIKQFYNTIDTKVIIEVNGMTSEIQKDNFIYNLFNNKLYETDDSDLIVLKSENEELHFLGLDYNWWLANSRRKNKMLKCLNTTSKEVIQELMYDIAIGTKNDTTVSDISTFKGNKKQTIEFINFEIKRRYIVNNLQEKTVINFSFDQATPSKIEDWYTLEELAEIGAIKLA